MIPDKFRHRKHADDVEMVEVERTHPVLEDHTIHSCPRPNCSFFETDTGPIGIDHDHTPSVDVDARLDELSKSVELPVYHTYHYAGCGREGKKAFQTYDEAEAFIFGRYKGTGNKHAIGNTIRKTYSRTSGTHSQSAEKKDYPMIFAVVNTALEKGEFGYVVGANLVPRKQDYPENAMWRSTPSVEEVFDYHLEPPQHIIASRYGETDHQKPDWYDGDALEWFIEQVEHYEIVIQTPDLFLDESEVEIANECADNWTAPQQTSA